MVLLAFLSTAFIYHKNPTVIDNDPIAPGKQPEPTATISPEPKSTPQIPSSTTDNNTIKVAAFNLQIYGTSKASKPEVMEVLSKIIRNYDVIAVQEIRDSSQTALPMLRDTVNSMGTSQYEYVVSDRLGRSSSKEQYAYIYNTPLFSFSIIST
jgi:hypothetical protein